MCTKWLINFWRGHEFSPLSYLVVLDMVDDEGAQVLLFSLYLDNCVFSSLGD
jgi:hypothetical protein